MNTEKVLTVFKIDATLKKLATESALQENRTLSNYIVCLIRSDVERRGLNPPTHRPRVSRKK